MTKISEVYTRKFKANIDEQELQNVIHKRQEDGLEVHEFQIEPFYKENRAQEVYLVTILFKEQQEETHRYGEEWITEELDETELEQL